MQHTRLALALMVLVPALAGCIGGADEPASSGPTDGPESKAPQASGGVRTLATATGTVDHLGLAVYDGIDPADVEPLVPGNMTPVPCFQPNTRGTIDVTLVVGQRSYEGVPDGGEPVPQVGLIGCAERPEGLARDAANEVAWVDLLGWVDNDAFAGFLSSIGFPNTQADITFQQTPRGYSVNAEKDGTDLLEAAFVTSPVGVPEAPFYRCEPGTQNGRSIGEAPNGSLIALDWNKTEAICPADAAITWSSDSPLADVLGEARPPSVVVDTRVEEARYWWRTLPEPGAGG